LQDNEIRKELRMEQTEELLEKIDQDIKRMLSQKRYQHSIGVMKKAIELAEKYHVDVNKAKVVGLAHDIAKDISTEEKLQYVQKYQIEIDEIEKVNTELLHSKIGAHICRQRYGFSEDMQKAILYHTTGNPEMDDLAKVIFIADKIEEGRTYINFAEIERIMEKGMNAILIYLLDRSIKFTIDKGVLIHLDTIYTRNRFLSEK